MRECRGTLDVSFDQALKAPAVFDGSPVAGGRSAVPCRPIARSRSGAPSKCCSFLSEIR